MAFKENYTTFCSFMDYNVEFINLLKWYKEKWLNKLTIHNHRTVIINFTFVLIFLPNQNATISFILKVELELN